MPNPLYNGVPCFGPAAIVNARVIPIARRTQGFSGLNGLVTKTFGSRGAVATARGILTAANATQLGLAEGSFEVELLASGAATLRDSTGRDWPNMIMIDFDNTAPIIRGADGGVCREYVVHFLGLTHPF